MRKTQVVWSINHQFVEKITLPTQNLLFSSKSNLPDNISQPWKNYVPPVSKYSTPLTINNSHMEEIERLLAESCTITKTVLAPQNMQSESLHQPINQTIEATSESTLVVEDEILHTETVDTSETMSNSVEVQSEPNEDIDKVYTPSNWDTTVNTFIASFEDVPYKLPKPEKKPRQKSKSAKTKAALPSMPRLLHLQKTLNEQFLKLLEDEKSADDEKNFKFVEITRTPSKTNRSKTSSDADELFDDDSSNNDLIYPWDVNACGVELTEDMKLRTYDQFPISKILYPFTPAPSAPLTKEEIQQLSAATEFFKDPSPEEYPLDLSKLEPIPQSALRARTKETSNPSLILSQVYGAASLADPAQMFSEYVEIYKKSPRKSRKECELIRNALLTLPIDTLNQLQYAMAAYYHRQVTGFALFPTPDVAAYYGMKPSQCGKIIYIRRHVDRNIGFGSKIYELLHDPESFANNAFAAFRTPVAVLRVSSRKFGFSALDFFHQYDHSDSVVSSSSGYIQTAQHDLSVVRRSFNKGLWQHDVIPWLSQLTLERTLQYEKRKQLEAEDADGEPIVQTLKVNYVRNSIYQKKRRVLDRLSKVESQIEEHVRLSISNQDHDQDQDDVDHEDEDFPVDTMKVSELLNNTTTVKKINA